MDVLSCLTQDECPNLCFLFHTTLCNLWACGSLFSLTFREMYVIDVFTKGLLFVKASLALP